MGFAYCELPSLRREAFRADLKAMGGYVLSGLWAGYRLIKRWQPDLIHVHFAVPAGALAWALSKLTGVPYLMTVHLGDVPGGVPEKTGNWFKWILPFHPSHLAGCEARGGCQRVYPSAGAQTLSGARSMVIPNGVDIDQLRPADIRVQEPPRIVFAGRFMEQKNPLQIVQHAG